VCPRAGLDAVGKRNESVLHRSFRESNPSRLAHSSVTILTKLHRLSGDEIKEDEMGGAVARMTDKRSAYILVGRPEEKVLLGHI
jgi:hypothetical protein